MNLAAWGFRTPESLAVQCAPKTSAITRAPNRAVAYVETKKVVAFAKKLGRVPSAAELRAQFGGCRETNRKRLMQIVKALA